jgi:hypothetical protein
LGPFAQKPYQKNEPKHKARHVDGELRIAHHLNVIVQEVHDPMNLMEIAPFVNENKYKFFFVAQFEGDFTNAYTR